MRYFKADYYNKNGNECYNAIDPDNLRVMYPANELADLTEEDQICRSKALARMMTRKDNFRRRWAFMQKKP